MSLKRKLDLKELELQLPPIDSNETKIILGGNDYDDNFINHFLDGGNDTQLPGDFKITEGPHSGGHHHTEQPDDDDDGRDDFDDYGDLDHLYDQDYDDGYPDGGHGTGTGTGWGSPTSIQFDAPLSILNGLSAQQIQNIDFSQIQNSNITNNISDLLCSNNGLASIVNDIVNSGLHLKFEIKPMEFGSTQNTPGTPDNDIVWGNTLYNYNTGEVTITINSHAFDANGNWWPDKAGGVNISHDGVDSTPFNALQDFAHTIAHEVIHAKYGMMWNNAWENSDKSPQGMYNYMVSHSGNDFANIYIVKDSNGDVHFRPNTEIGTLEHNYMTNHDADTIKNIVTEFTNDLHDLQHTVDNIRQNMHNAEAHFNDDGEQNPPGGDWWKAFHEHLQGELHDIMQNWGQFVDKGF